MRQQDWYSRTRKGLRNITSFPRRHSTSGTVDVDLSHSFLDPVLRGPAVDMARSHQLIDSFFNQSSCRCENQLLVLADFGYQLCLILCPADVNRRPSLQSDDEIGVAPRYSVFVHRSQIQKLIQTGSLNRVPYPLQGKHYCPDGCLRISAGTSWCFITSL
jgi:hypothetical protein